MLTWTYKPTGGVSLYLHSTAGDEGVIADFSSESISAPVLLPATIGQVRFGFVVEPFLYLENWRSYKIFLANKYFSYDPMLMFMCILQIPTIKCLGWEVTQVTSVTKSCTIQMKMFSLAGGMSPNLHKYSPNNYISAELHPQAGAEDTSCWARILAVGTLNLDATLAI